MQPITARSDTFELVELFGQHLAQVWNQLTHRFISLHLPDSHDTPISRYLTRITLKGPNREAGINLDNPCRSIKACTLVNARGIVIRDGCPLTLGKLPERDTIPILQCV